MEAAILTQQLPAWLDRKHDPYAQNARLIHSNIPIDRKKWREASSVQTWLADQRKNSNPQKRAHRDPQLETQV
jgi:hypothetical protein